jgi:hypothetical protein
MKTRLLIIFILLFLVPVGVYAIDARVETTDGEVFTIIDFSMEGRQHFSVDYKGATTALDWKNIASFEVKQVGSNFWVEVHLLDGKKEVFGVRQVSPFRGRSDFGKWSVPFEKVKKVSLIGEAVQGKRQEAPYVKEFPLSPSQTPKEVDRITMKNGDILLGDILNEIISIRTGYGTLSFKKEAVHRLLLGASGKGQKEKEGDAIYSKYGDKLTGTIADLHIRINLLTDTRLSLSREHIKEIEFGVMPEVEQKIPTEKITESIPKSPISQ